MSYIKQAKGSTEEKKIVNARIASTTIEAINNASMLFKFQDEGKEISMSGIISQAMDEAVKQCSDDLLIDLKKLAEYKIKIEACMNVINKHLNPSLNKELMIVNDKYKFSSPKLKKEYEMNCEMLGNYDAYQSLKEATKTDKHPLSKADMIRDPKFKIDIEHEYLSLANIISRHVSHVFKTLEHQKNKKSAKFDDLFSNISPILVNIFDLHNVKSLKQLDDIIINIRNSLVEITTAEEVNSKLEEFLWLWLWVLNNSKDTEDSKKIRTVFIKQGFSRYDEGGYLQR